MGKRKLKGFTLVEIIIAMFLLSFIVIMVSGAVTSSYKLAHNLRALPNTYYNVQGELEDYSAKLSKIVNERDSINKKLDQMGIDLDYYPENITPENVGEVEPLVDKLRALDAAEAELNAEAGITPKETHWSLLGRDVTVYQISKVYDKENAPNITIYTGVVGSAFERPVPVIDKVTITIGGDALQDAYFTGTSGSTTVYATAPLKDENKEYYSETLFQWYVSIGNFHTVEYEKDHGPTAQDVWDRQWGTIFPAYPANYSFLAGEKSSSIAIKEAYYNRMLVCVATPLSINGAMGTPVVSNAIYISGLPDLGNDAYKIVLEPSLITIPYDASGKVRVSKIDSSDIPKNATVDFKSGKADLDINGELTATDPDSVPDYAQSYSRYLTFSHGPTKSIKSDKLDADGALMVFAVVRNNVGSEVAFCDVGGKKITAPAADGKWKIIGGALTASKNDKMDVGLVDNENGSIDIAEFIVVQITEEMDTESAGQISRYLAAKYNISGSSNIIIN